MMKVILRDENMSKINLSIFLLCSILTACVSSDSYFVRFWNGDVIPKRTYEEQKIFESCYEKYKNLPDKTNEEREVISLKVMDCISHDKLKEKEK